MSTPANDRDPLLLSSEVIAHSAEPLIGELTLTTDRGDVVVAITRQAAEELLEELVSFLDTE